MKPKDGTKRLTLDIKEENHTKLKTLAAQTGKSMKQLVEQVLETHLEAAAARE